MCGPSCSKWLRRAIIDAHQVVFLYFRLLHFETQRLKGECRKLKSVVVYYMGSKLSSRISLNKNIAELRPIYSVKWNFEILFANLKMDFRWNTRRRTRPHSHYRNSRFEMDICEIYGCCPAWQIVVRLSVMNEDVMLGYVIRYVKSKTLTRRWMSYVVPKFDLEGIVRFRWNLVQTSIMWQPMYYKRLRSRSQMSKSQRDIAYQQ